MPVTRCYVALGVDPAPGDADGVDALARTCRSAASALGSSADRLRGLAATPGWDGQAADALAGRLRALAERLDGGAGALHRLGGELATWGSALREAQGRAWRLEREARTAQAALPDEGAADELRGLRRHADRLRAEVSEDAERAARALREAAAAAPGPVWREQLRAEIDRWVVDDLRAVAGAADDVVAFADRHEQLVGGVALVAGVLTLPVGGLAGVALAGVALGATGLRAAAGDAGPLEVGLAGAGVLTGGLTVGAARLAAGARSTASTWAAVGRSSDATGKGLTVGGLVPLVPLPSRTAPARPERPRRPVAGPARPLLTGQPGGRALAPAPAGAVPRPLEFGPPVRP